ncbi:MAG: CGNR zinc finger domain-containing protein [Candidatus Micrarchaeota archaeon]|nr:CGNR zinc finger domain-containing protein [Candidatus Micrarchaeota archaeon]
MLKICANPKCNNIVPASKNPGVPRKFCSGRCAHRYHSRAYYEREMGSEGKGMLKVNDDGISYVSRTPAPNAKAATKRRTAHDEHCAVHGGGPCPAATIDFWNRKKVCLVRAVLMDDERELSRRENPILKPPYRLCTSRNGYWLSDDEQERVKQAIMTGEGIDMLQEVRDDYRLGEDPEAVSAFHKGGGGHLPDTV